MAQKRFSSPARVIRVPSILQMPGRNLKDADLLASTQNLPLSDLTRTTKSALEQALERGRNLAPEALRSYAGLQDELAFYVTPPPRPPVGLLAQKVLREFAVYNAMAKRQISFNTATFLELLLDVHRRLGKGRTTFRKTHVQIAPDANNAVTVFPDWRNCEGLLSELGEFIVSNITARPLLTAMVGYVGVIHAHPFSDGNGRTARVLYSCILGAAGSQHFLPIKAVSELSDGAFLIKIRRAYLGGDWTGLQAFFHDAMLLSDRLQRDVRA